MRTEQSFKLGCHIDNENNPIDMLQKGLEISMKGQVEKNSPSLGRMALYEQTTKINRLVSKHLILMFF